MPVLENPSRFEGTVTYGSFVLVTVDIAASIRGVTDKVAIAAAEALPRANSLAWIRMNTSYPGSPLFHVVFLLVDRRLPAPPLSFSAVPVAPNTEHPDTGRAAVLPSRPFPWPDCYIYTLQDVTAPISRLHESPGRAICLDEDQTERVLLACYEDADARAELEDAASDSSEADDFGLPPGWRIRDHGDYGSVVYEGSGSRADALSHGSRAEDPIEQDHTATGDAASVHPSSVHGPTPDPPADQDPKTANDVAHEEHTAETGIIFHVEVSGVLDPSVEFGSAADFMAVVQQLYDIEDDRAEREAGARLARAVAPKTTAWLQGVSAADALEEPVADAPPPELGSLFQPGSSSGEDIVQTEQSPSAVSPRGNQPQSVKSPPDKEMQDGPSRREKNAAHSQPAGGLRSLDGSVRAPAPQQPNGGARVFPEPVRPSSPSRDGIEAGSARPASPKPREGRAPAPEGSRSPFPIKDPPKDLEAGRLPQSVSPTTKADAATQDSPPPSRRTGRALRSLLISRFRTFIAKCRALF